MDTPPSVPTAPSTQELVEIEEYLSQNMANLWKSALRVARGDRSLADDLTQETAILILRKWSTFKTYTRRHKEGWTRETMRLIALQRQKLSLRTEPLDQGEADAIPEPSAHGGNPGVTTADQLAYRELWSAAADLPPRQREVFVMDFLGWTTVQIAKRLGVSTGAVRSNRRHARKALRQDPRVAELLNPSTDEVFDAESRPPKPPGDAGSGPPLIEIALPNGSVKAAHIEDSANVPHDLLTLSGPYVIEELSEHVHVATHRTVPRVDCRRRIRALTADVRRFSYAFEGSPDSGLRRVVIECHDDAVVSRVIRVGRSSYIFHFDLPEPLDAGQAGDISFSLLTDEEGSDEPRHIYGKRQFVATDRVSLSVEFAEEVVPAQVRWFMAPIPSSKFPDSFNFPTETFIEAGPGRRYEKTFLRTDLPEGRIVGMVWDY